MESPFKHIDHRPWPLRSGMWVMAQRWHDLLFAHWPVPVDAVRPLVPATLEIETFDGRAWVGVIPFRMTGVRLRGLPALPGVSAFPELNVRTYVRHGDRPGVWFFSLDAASAVAVTVARAWFALPYFRADMLTRHEDGGVYYSSARTHRDAPRGTFEARYAPVGAAARADKGTLDHFLTERYCLYAADPRGRVWRGDIHHRPWPLQPARAEFAHNTMADAAGLRLPDVEPVLHFARDQDVRIWRPVRVTN
jgi:uncharacterized protein